MRVREGRSAAWLSGRAFHVALLIAGTLFLLTGAFHGNVWFDESYSIAIANHSFAEIWRIGSGDVHPVLFYWALHVLNLVFGQNVLVYRLFAAAGAVALGVLGYTHIRRDFGWRPGVLFSFFALFTPYIAVMAVEVRMYSWATFTVMVCAIYAWRIFCVLRSGGVLGEGVQAVRDQAAGKRAVAGVPVRWWVFFFLASLASAYLHYFGVFSAFMVNVLLFAFLVRTFRTNTRALGVYAVCAVVVVALYVPWLLVLKSQVGVVSQTYWANVVFPTTYIELVTYPLMTSSVSFAARGAYGVAWQVVLVALWVAALVVVCVLVARVVCSVKNRRRAKAQGDAVLEGDAVAQGDAALQGGALNRFAAWLRSNSVLPIACALAVYLGVFAIALTASCVMNSLILYYRYLFIAIGPLLLAISLLLTRVNSRALAAAVCALVLGVSVVNQALLVYDDYSPQNQEPLQQFEQQAEELAAQQGGAYPLIVSSDIGIEGVMAVEFRTIPQTYMDWQKGNWGLAYESYGPTLTSKKSWELIFDDFHGTFMVLGQAQTSAMPRDVADLDAKDGFTLISLKTYYRPYERTWFTIAVMEKE